MAFEYSTQGATLDFPNPYRIENQFLFARGLVLAAAGIGLLVMARGAGSEVSVQGVNADTAHALLQILQAVRLLGARALISGVRGAVAQSLVATGADLSTMHAVPSLRAALRACGVREHRLARPEL